MKNRSFVGRIRNRQSDLQWPVRFGTEDGDGSEQSTKCEQRSRSPTEGRGLQSSKVKFGTTNASKYGTDRQSGTAEASSWKWRIDRLHRADWAVGLLRADLERMVGGDGLPMDRSYWMRANRQFSDSEWSSQRERVFGERKFMRKERKYFKKWGF